MGGAIFDDLDRAGTAPDGSRSKLALSA